MAWREPTRPVYEHRPNGIWRREDGVEVRLAPKTRAGGTVAIVLEPNPSWSDVHNGRVPYGEDPESRTLVNARGVRRTWKTPKNAMRAIDRERPPVLRLSKARRHEIDDLLPFINELGFEFDVYPGICLVSAATILRLYDCPEEAGLRGLKFDGGYYSHCAAEGNCEIRGSGGVATNAVQALLNFRVHGDLDQVVQELRDRWGRLVLHQDSYRDRYDEGVAKMDALEPAFRQALAVWYGI